MSERTRIDRIVEDVLACEPGERDAFLDAACEGNPALRREIASLLEHATRTDSFLGEPASPPSLIGRTLGPYRIDAPIGAGGMGEVYRARDTKLGRDVAIKILPAFMAQDPDHLARLGREARTLAALNHPHIGSIYGLEESDGIRGLVLELVDGDTLADRIARGPLAIGEALRIAGQIAEALAAAHAKGIVHRDLKPANIKITSAGSVKVLDFGLAKADADQSDATTLATREGTVMGTPAYMSPEQARGEAVDPQTDIWAFGCVLYEMLARRRAFGGATASDCIAAILKAEPDWAALPAATPAAVRTLLARCLAKDRGRRLHSIADAQFDLERPSESPAPASPGRPRTVWRKWLLAAALGLAIGVAGYVYAPSRETYNTELDLPDGNLPWSGVAISPDGKSIAASVSPSGDAGRHLIVRYVDQPIGWQDLKAGDKGESPFWSPDSKHLAFFVEDKLLRADPPNAAPVVICAVKNGRGGVWLEDGTIVFAGLDGPLMRVSEKGGVPTVFVPIGEGQYSLRYPVSAGPGRLLYFAQHLEDSRSELRLLNLDAPERPATVLKTSRSGVYAGGFLFYDRDGIILRQRFNPATNQLQGEPARVTSDAGLASGRQGYLPLSAAGGHVAVATIPQPLNQLVWMARNGERIRALGDKIDQGGPDLSPDGTRIVIARRLAGEGKRNVWIMDLESGVSRALTTGSDEYAAVWAPDGERVAFVSTAGLLNSLHAVNVEGPPTPTVLAEPHLGQISPLGWANDSRIAWTAWGYTSDDDLSTLGIFLSGGSTGSRDAAVAFRTGMKSSGGRFSPDGRYVAFVSGSSGQSEVYVDTFPMRATRPKRLSKNGGRWVRWSRDGRELYFVERDELMAVHVLPGNMGLGDPERLFRLPLPNQFAGSFDGSTFLVLEQKTLPSAPIKVALNWFSSQAARD